MKSKKLFFGKELVFSEILALLIALLSDFLKPLGDITFYVFFFSAASVLILIIIFWTKKILREKLSNYFLASITLMIISGSLYLSYDESNYDSGLLAASFPFMGNLQNDLGIIEKEIAEIKESTLRTESLVKSIASDSKENIKQTKELNKTIRSSNENIVNKLDEINDSFVQISKLGGLISNPKRPEEFYNNARVYETRGDYLNARRSYNQYFSFKLDYIDPHLRYQAFLKIQEGRAGAREVYNSFFESDQRLIIEFLKISLYDAPTRTSLLRKFLDRNPDFAPAYYELSKDYSPSRTGQESLSNRKAELENLESFLEQNAKGKFVRYFLDKSMADEWVKYSEERLKILNAGLNEVKETYFDDGSVYKRTNYKDGVRSGEGLVFANKNDFINVFNGIIEDHESNGREVLIKVSDLEWHKGKNVIIRRNFFNGGQLERSEDITYYITGEVFKYQTSIPASDDILKLLRDELSTQQYLYDREEERSIQFKINNCDDRNNRSSYDCMGLGFSSRSDLGRYEKRIKEIENEITNAMEVTGSYKYFYKNGQTEDEGTNRNGEKSSYALYSSNGMLEEKGNIKIHYWPNGSVYKPLHGPYERYYKNGQTMIKGVFSDGTLISPYRVFYETGSLYLEKDSKDEYKKYDRDGRLLLEAYSAKCEKEQYMNRAGINGFEKVKYQCYKIIKIDEDNEKIMKNISIRPFQSNDQGNCLKPTYVCEGLSPNILSNFFE